MILFIDDEPEYTSNYEIALVELGFEVVTLIDVDDVFGFLDENHDSIECIVLDSMMSFGKRFSKAETENGTRTGVVFYREFRKIMPSTKVFVLTNVTDVKVETFFLDEPNCYFDNKSIKPFPFARKVKTILEKNNASNTNDA